MIAISNWSNQFCTLAFKKRDTQTKMSAWERVSTLLMGESILCKSFKLKETSITLHKYRQHAALKDYENANVNQFQEQDCSILWCF